MKLGLTLVSTVTLALFELCLIVKPANAASTSCWYGNQGERLEHFVCDVQRRTNYNGHVVWNVRIKGNKKLFTFVLWGQKNARSGIADLIYKGESRPFQWHKDRDGDLRLTNTKGRQFAVRFPGHAPPRRESGVAAVASAYGELFQ